jgi:hypothetical protein
MSDEDSKILFGASNVFKLTHKSKRQCQRTIVAIRKFVGKTKKQPVTYFDGARYFGLSPADILRLAY